MSHYISISFRFIITLFALGIVPSLYIINEYDRVHNSYIANLQQRSQDQITYTLHQLNQIVLNIDSSVNELVSSRSFNRVIASPTVENKEAVSDIWKMITSTQRYYSQLRLFDSQGMEKIRVNYDGKTSEVVPDEQLQNKFHRDYFRFAKTLRTDSVDTFGIDYEMEHGVYVQPFTPTFRIIKSIDRHEENVGYLIANLSISEIFNQIQFNRDSDVSLSLINDDGYTLMGDDLDSAFGNIIPARATQTLAIQNKPLWDMMNSQAKGQYYHHDQWYAFTQLNSLLVHESQEPLYILIAIKEDSFNELLANAQQTLYEKSVILFILIMCLTSWFTFWHTNHKKKSIDNQLAQAAMNGMSAMIVTDKNNRIVKVNQEFTRLSGFTLSDVIGQQPSVFSSGKHRQEFFIQMWKELQEKGIWQGEVVNQHKNGELITEILRIQTIRDANKVIQFYVASFVDITERKKLENRLRELSEKDALANCWNRRKFDIELNNEHIRANRYPDKSEACLAIIDIDNFKPINDQLGHDEGDKTIKQVARILQRECRETDFIARIGGEEFGLILPHTSIEEAYVVLNRLRAAISRDTSHNITISGGLTNIATSSAHSYKCADLALYESKTTGKDCISIFSSDELSYIA
ncbi:hypothetical protein BCU68_13135 [Vibrio sp. 10N.286.49.B3]|uniref:sensor domain-containing diguanylate cyclase n=1 Tax=Vibrio sp. 10N.286.49.B3 TaxID=1880855 RepID=UPI000C815AA4|nr:diguanylate cyclase [Vibrio sp. 10N.286.49.B3]PMH43786.1 hypothetical protein BCU68_13135 [Vibrio sp. 10N.286.49.B3]